MNLEEIYKGKNVFLTGHTGFKGSWMLKWLDILGAKVKGYALSPLNTYDLYNTIGGDKICDSVISDIRNFDILKNEIDSFQPDFVFHLAAQPLVRYSYSHPIETFDVNIMGTANVLESIKNLNCEVIGVMVTTDKVYENKELDYAYKESDRLGGYDPYSASKASAEIVINSYRNSFFNSKDFVSHQKSISSARAGNVIGGGDWAKDRIIPDIVRALKEEREIEVRNPNAIRPWQHVLESIGGYLHLAGKMYNDRIKYNQSWNFGPKTNDSLTVEQLVKNVIEIWGDGTYKKTEDKNAPHEAGLLHLDIEKSVKELDWAPKLNSKQAIEWTIEYYKSKNPIETIENQIRKYQMLNYGV